MRFLASISALATLIFSSPTLGTTVDVHRSSNLASSALAIVTTSLPAGLYLRVLANTSLTSAWIWSGWL